MRSCSRCGEVKPASAFNRSGVRLKSGRRTRRADCALCQAAYGRIVERHGRPPVDDEELRVERLMIRREREAA